MSYTIDLIVDPDMKNPPTVVVTGDGAYLPATSMAIIADDDLVILPFIEGFGKSQCTQLFELDVPLSKPKVYRFVARTADGYALGEEVELLVEPQPKVITSRENGGVIA